jgi:site-specific DNA-methyltransferase (adenine-specific)
VNHLFYGDNLEVLRKYIKDESVDLCYIDPPFNSKRNYNQIYNNIGEDKAQAQAFIDTWEWNSLANEGFIQIMDNYQGKFTTQTIALIAGLKEVLGQGSLLAYLVSITLRVVEIHRVLKPTGSFYLHCDSTASHYLKLILDSIFCSLGGDFRNEIVWAYDTAGRATKNFNKKHDTIFWYSKSKKEWTFNGKVQGVGVAREATNHMKLGKDEDGRIFYEKKDKPTGNVYRWYLDNHKIRNDYWNDIYALDGEPADLIMINGLNREERERLGYPTQKPKALLERIIKASSNEGDTVLDAYCGCGTTVEVSQYLNRKWIGIDITYQSISLILKRLEGSLSRAVLNQIKLDGIPKDMKSAVALANRQDDRTRKEFEKWAVLTYSNNRATINQKKGADRGIDGFAYFLEEGEGHRKIVLQVKSGKVNSRDIRDLYGTMNREKAAMAIFITLKEPTADMKKEAQSCGIYQHKAMGRNYPCIQIITIREILEEDKRLDVPLSLEVLRSAEKKSTSEQLSIPLDDSGIA